jgi:hypothetical protein
VHRIHDSDTFISSARERDLLMEVKGEMELNSLQDIDVPSDSLEKVISSIQHILK